MKHMATEGEDEGYVVTEWMKGDPHPELERPLLSLPAFVSHHTCPLKM